VGYYASGTPVGGVTLSLTGPTTNANAATDAAGQYAFAAVANETLQLTPRKTGDVGMAVSALDATYVLQWLVGLRVLNSEQLLAADVSGNGFVSAFDASLILQYTVGLITTFPAATKCGSDWHFVPNPAAVPNQQVVTPLLEPASCRPGSIGYNPLSQDATGQDFRAIVIGDITGNWSPPPAGTPTPTRTPTIAGTPTRTPTPGPGPRVAIAALVPGNGCFACGIGNCICGGSPTPTPGYDAQGRRVFPWVDGVGFWLVIEAVAGTNGAPPSGSLPAPCTGGGRPSLEIESNRPLGDGQPPFCPPPPTPPQVTGVPGFPVPDFGSSPAVLEALQAFGSRFTFELAADDACTLDGNGNPNFLSVPVPPTPVNPTTRQYCYLVSPSLRFPGGDTVLTMQVADGGGVVGPTAQIVVRLPTPTPTPG